MNDPENQRISGQPKHQSPVFRKESIGKKRDGDDHRIQRSRLVEEKGDDLHQNDQKKQDQRKQSQEANHQKIQQMKQIKRNSLIY